MDGNEVCRQRAAELNASLVGAGIDPWDVLAIVEAEATRRDIEIQKVPIGDVRLRNARALFDPDALLIVHEDSEDAFLRAFLIAHEIGHSEFGGHAGVICTTNVDPERSTEASPVGMDRVVDYSHHERIEVRMDLFARELLMPRAWVRSLHVEDGLSANSIAARLKVPFEVVVQQLLDATLLPAISLSTKAPLPEQPLNEDQRFAVDHRGVPFILEASPGTGKTQTLIARVDSLLKEGVDPSRILVLTFSNKAAGELSERLVKKRPLAAGSLWVGTFHGFGLDLIRRFHSRLDLPPDPRLLDRVEAIDLLEGEIPRLNLVHFKNLWDPSLELVDILSAISRAKDEITDPIRYKQLAEHMLKDAGSDPVHREDAEKCMEVASVYSVYEQLKRENGCIDFGDLVTLPIRLFEENADIRAHLASLYEHVLVDEYQDVNRASVRLLAALSPSGRNLWVVGDPKQSIYRFRGASSFNVARFGKEDFPGGGRRRLKLNYRSSQEIVDCFMRFSGTMSVTGGVQQPLKADRGFYGTHAQHLQTGSADDEIALVAERIEAHLKKKVSYRDQAILCAGNARLNDYAAGLERLGIPVLFLGSLFERPEIKDLIALASIMVDRRAAGLVRIAATDYLPMSLAETSCVLEFVRSLDLPALEWMERLGEIKGVSEAGRANLFLLKGMLEGFDPAVTPWRFLSTILFDRTRLAASICGATNIESRSKGIAIWQFMNFLRLQPSGSGLPIRRLMDRVRRLVLLSDDRDLRQLPAAAQGIDAVRLMTMHGSKGLEFPVVHIPTLTADSLPRSANSFRGIAPPDGMIDGAQGRAIDALKAGHVEEQECMFFVALSRAKDCLNLYSPSKKSNGTNRPVSSFVERLGDQAKRGIQQPAKNVPPDPTDNPIPVQLTPPLSLSDHHIAQYERCARRFFYTHILEVGGRRTESAFMQMHSAVQSVIDQLAAVPPGEALVLFEPLLSKAWSEKGPQEHGYSEDFRRVANRLLEFYLESQKGLARQDVEMLRLPVGGAEILIRPDLVLKGVGGQTHVRRVMTGHHRSAHEESVSSAVFQLSATAAAPGCIVELVYLSDQTVNPLGMSATKLKNRRANVEKMLGDMREGKYPADVDRPDRSCPRCPSFYICGPVPLGPLAKKI